jgi:hypothetical protein
MPCTSLGLRHNKPLLKSSHQSPWELYTSQISLPPPPTRMWHTKQPYQKSEPSIIGNALPLGLQLPRNTLNLSLIMSRLEELLQPQKLHYQNLQRLLSYKRLEPCNRRNYELQKRAWNALNSKLTHRWISKLKFEEKHLGPVRRACHNQANAL